MKRFAIGVGILGVVAIAVACSKPAPDTSQPVPAPKPTAAPVTPPSVAPPKPSDQPKPTALARIDAKQADELAGRGQANARNLKFDDKFVLRGAAVSKTAAGVKVELAWEALQTEPLAYGVAVHVNDAGGKILKQADYPQDPAKANVDKGTLWRDDVLIPAEKMLGGKTIGIALYDAKVVTLPIDKGPRDWDGRRLLLNLP